MKSFQASAVINATPNAIWAILVDGPHYPDWDSARFATGLKKRAEQPG